MIMPKVEKKNNSPVNLASVDIGYEAELWQMTNFLRGSIDSSNSTPHVVVFNLLVEILESFQGLVYYPCYGSVGVFVQSVNFMEAHLPRKAIFAFIQHIIFHLSLKGYTGFGFANSWFYSKLGRS